ncbi:MAG: hypothetical protein ACI9MB_003511, partial [Verrucomicrobiales bacterium]
MFSLTTIHLLRAEQMKFVSTRSSAAAVTFAEA